MDMMDKLNAVTKDLNRRFSDGNEPFQIMTRLLEKCGELAERKDDNGQQRIERTNI
jgi:hypothetical protein